MYVACMYGMLNLWVHAVTIHVARTKNIFFTGPYFDHMHSVYMYADKKNIIRASDIWDCACDESIPKGAYLFDPSVCVYVLVERKCVRVGAFRAQMCACTRLFNPSVCVYVLVQPKCVRVGAFRAQMCACTRLFNQSVCVYALVQPKCVRVRACRAQMCW